MFDTYWEAVAMACVCASNGLPSYVTVSTLVDSQTGRELLPLFSVWHTSEALTAYLDGATDQPLINGGKFTRRTQLLTAVGV